MLTVSSVYQSQPAGKRASAAGSILPERSTQLTPGSHGRGQSNDLGGDEERKRMRFLFHNLKGGVNNEKEYHFNYN